MSDVPPPAYDKVPPPAPPGGYPVGTPGAPGPQIPEVFCRRLYTVQRKIFKLFGGAFYVLDETGRTIGYSTQAAFKLKEDIRVYTDTDCATELLAIKARSIIDFGAVYDVFDAASGQPLGSLRRKGWASSLVQDNWLVFNAAGAEVGKLYEYGTGLAILRRIIGPLMQLISPQSYVMEIGPVQVATMSTRRNPFVYKLDVDIIPTAPQYVDPRVVLAGGILLAAIEGHQG